MNKRNYLVLASGGKTGKRVLKRLQELGEEVRGASRSTPIPFDWENETTWDRALEGVNSVYAVFTPDLAVSYAPSVIKGFVVAARRMGVEHVVMLSGRGELEAQACENILIESGLRWTITRASWFSQNFSEGFFREDVLRGMAYFPIVKAKEPFVDVDDIADVVVECLLHEKHHGKIYELTGPNLLSFGDCFRKISSVIGTPIDVQELPIEQYTKILSEAGVPGEYVSLLEYLFAQVLDGRNESVRTEIAEILGRPARTFELFAETAAQSGAWKA